MLVTLKDDVAVEESWESFAVREPDPGMLLQFLDAMEFRTLGRRVREHYAKEKGAAIVAQYAAESGAVRASDRRGRWACRRSGGNRVSPRSVQDRRAIIADLEALDRARAGERAWSASTPKRVRFDAQRAELVGVSLALGANDACYVPLAHRAADPRAGELFASELDIGR